MRWFFSVAILWVALALPVWGVTGEARPVSREPGLSFSPTEIYFNEAFVGHGYADSVTVTNSGDTAITIIAIVMTGSPYMTPDNIPPLPLILDPGEAFWLVVNYYPQESGRHYSGIQFTTAELQPITYSVIGQAFWTSILSIPYVADVPNITGWETITIADGPGTLIFDTYLDTAQEWSQWVGMRNSPAGNDTLMLCSPLIASELQINTLQFSFRAFATMPGQTLIVGMLQDIADPASFCPLDTLVLTTFPVTYPFSLADYSGTARRITFRHGLGLAQQTIYLRDFFVEYIPQTDLRMVTLMNPKPVAAGSQAIIISRIYNRGTQPVSDYEILLFVYGETQALSFPGTSILSGETKDVPIIFAAGQNLRIRTEISYSEDQNNLNNSSGWVDLNVLPAGYTYVQIGEEDSSNRIPIDFYSKNSLFETMLYQNEIGMTGMISGISLFSMLSSAGLNQKPIKIWIGEVDEANLCGGWVPASALTLVYDSNFTFPNSIRIIHIPFTQPYCYTGGNLVIMIMRPWDTSTYEWDDRFSTYMAGINRSRMLTSNSIHLSANDPPSGGSLNGITPVMILRFAPQDGLPLTVVSPPSRSFDDTLIGSEIHQSFIIRNAGQGTLNCTGITLAGNPAYDFFYLPDLPVNLSSGMSICVMVRYAPQTIGEHNTRLLVTDDQARTTITIPISGRGINGEITELPLIENFDNLEEGMVPQTWIKLIRSNSPNARLEASFIDSQTPPVAICFYNSTDQTSDLILSTPPLAETFSVPDIRVKFRARSPIAGTMQIGVIDDPNDAQSFVLCGSFSLTDTWSAYCIDLTNYNGLGRRIAFRHGADGMSLSLWLDTVRLELIPSYDLEALTISGNPTPTLGMSTIVRTKVKNWGTEEVSNYTVRLYSGLTCLAIANGVPLASGAETVLSVPWTPSEIGNDELFFRCVLTGDSNSFNNVSPVLAVNVQAPGTQILTLPPAEESFQPIPWDFSSQNSLYEMILTHSDLYESYGMITGMTLYSRFITQISEEPVRIWMGQTDSDVLTETWIPASGLSLVFDGVITPSLDLAPLTLVFPDAFDYRSGRNLVILFQRPLDTIFFNSYNRFLCYPAPPSRARAAASNFTNLDPLAPDVGVACGFFPKLSLIMTPGGVGDLQGRVTSPQGTGVPGVNLFLRGTQYQTHTDSQGYYSFSNLISGSYTVELNLFGWAEREDSVSIVDGQITILDAVLEPYPVITVSGTIVGSDTHLPLASVCIRLYGYQGLETFTGGDGSFTFSEVYGSHTYRYQISKAGYQELSGSWILPAEDLTLSEIILPEIADQPINLLASLDPENHFVSLQWEPPNALPGTFSQGFEGEVFPPPGWSRITSNTSPPGADGLSPTWSRLGSINTTELPATPPQGLWQAGLGWDTGHQDEWLISPLFNCPWGATLSFSSYHYGGSGAGDHYYVKCSNDGGLTWSILWDASEQHLGITHYTPHVRIDLSSYFGQEIMLAWQAVDPPDNEGLWHPWFIDDVRITQELTRSKISRALTGYRIYRLSASQETEPDLWTRIADPGAYDLTFTDTAWDSLMAGDYRWAISGVYSQSVLSSPLFSNTLTKVVFSGMISGVVRFGNDQPVSRATIRAGAYSTVANLSGAYSLILPVGEYAVTAEADGFEAQTVTGVIVQFDQSVTVNFYLSISADSDPVAFSTELIGNRPNPFSSRTDICYSLAERLPVEIAIYNLRGQLVRRLKCAAIAPGMSSIAWDRLDDKGLRAANGIYYYRFTAGGYSRIGKMLLLQ